MNHPTDPFKFTDPLKDADPIEAFDPFKPTDLLADADPIEAFDPFKDADPLEATEPTTTEAPAAEPATTELQPVDVEALIAEAEQRGYLRGRNERIEQLIATPGIYERNPTDPAGSPAASEVMILNNLRPSVWD